MAISYARYHELFYNLCQGDNPFINYQLSAFTENQVRALIQKIPYDENIKALFVKKLDTGLYETHKDFLVNPLYIDDANNT
jgi:hypothetical protein